MKLSWLSPTPVQVWAVEPGAAQITWGRLAHGQITVQHGDESIDFVHEGGAGSVIVNNLPAGPIDFEVRSIEGIVRLQTEIPEAPPGEELARIATISDLHLGSKNWGALRTIGDLDPGESDRYPMRCAVSAIEDAIEWGATLLVIKGDAAHHRHDRHYELVGQMVDRFPKLPMILVPGNHDVDNASNTELPQTVGKRGLPFERTVRTHDMPGARVIVGNTSIDGENIGTVVPIREDLLEAASSSETQNLLLLHHQFQEHRLLTYWPPGIPVSEAKPFLDELGETAPRTLVSSGHTHRNRTRRAGPLLITEVCSTKDWPGCWAGYRVFEGGMYQTARRVSAPRAISWTEYSRRAVGGLWSPWSPGKLSDRCAAL